jgi:hypothetical protein
MRSYCILAFSSLWLPDEDIEAMIDASRTASSGIDLEKLEVAYCRKSRDSERIMPVDEDTSQDNAGDFRC